MRTFDKKNLASTSNGIVIPVAIKTVLSVGEMSQNNSIYTVNNILIGVMTVIYDIIAKEMP